MHILSSKKKVGTSVLELRSGNLASLQFIQSVQYYKFEDNSLKFVILLVSVSLEIVNSL
jgi:hypothetical protein